MAPKKANSGATLLTVAPTLWSWADIDIVGIVTCESLLSPKEEENDVYISKI